MSTKKICLTAVFTALIFIVTRFIQIPIPLGYFNVGNCIILLFCFLVPSPYGIIAGSIGSALADLLSFPVWTIPTLIIKALMPLVFYILARIIRKEGNLKYFIAGGIAMLIPFLGYTFIGALIYGSLQTGLLQIPGLAVEYGANLVIFIILVIIADKSGLRRIVNE